MRWTSVWVMALATGVLAAGNGPARPVSLSAGVASAVVKAIETERTQAAETLRTSPTSYLATIGRTDFGNKQALSVGRAADNDVRLEAAGIASHHLSVTVEGDQFRVETVDASARFIVDKEEKTRALVPPTYIKVGPLVLRLSHQRFPAIIVFDPQSPRFKAYKGLQYFPVDLKYRYELPLTPNPKPEEIVILSTLGHRRRALRVGWFEFLVGDVPCRLEATRLLEPGVGEDSVMVLFRDTTSGAESYPLGRYVDAKKLAADRYLLDFNLAYNPACAFSDHYNCPVPPRANSLKVAIRAGEKDPHYH
jgi:uncharacterized protein